MKSEPLDQHRWLSKLLGQWTYEAQCSPQPDQPPVAWRGTERVRSLGGLWFLCEGAGEMPGGGLADTLMTLGYDPGTKRFVGTWIGSMMTHLWVYDGELDASGKVLTLNAEGPDMAKPGATAKYRDVIEVTSDTQRTLTSHILTTDGDGDGRWVQFMVARYTRTG